jgi:hypothetical protein
MWQQFRSWAVLVTTFFHQIFNLNKEHGPSSANFGEL